MARDSSNVKRSERWLDQLLAWADSHPRMAWWLVIMAHVNLLLNIVGVFH